MPASKRSGPADEARRRRRVAERIAWRRRHGEAAAAHRARTARKMLEVEREAKIEDYRAERREQLLQAALENAEGGSLANGGAGAAGAAWDSANSCVTARSAWQEKRRVVAAARAELRRITSLPRVRLCGAAVTGETVTVALRRDGRAVVHGVQSCGSVWACPRCAAKIEATRADELARAIAAHAAGGGRVWMLTLTMRHRAGQGLRELWQACSVAWHAAAGGYSGPRAALAAAGVQGWVRRVEVTHGRHGWHVHAHALLFAGSDGDVESAADAVAEAWSRRLVRCGLDAPLREHAIDLHEVRVAGEDDAPRVVGCYLSKGYFSAAAELGSAGKRARGGNRTPFEVLAAIVNCADGKDVGDRRVWAEWEDASRGRRALTWSRGLRKRLLGEAPLLDDDAIAAEWERDVVSVLTVARDEWRRIVRLGLVEDLLEAAELGDLEREYAVGLVRRRARAPG